jgi:hypothetical protein
MSYLLLPPLLLHPHSRGRSVKYDRPVELQGGFKALRDKGLRITSYYDSSEGKG